MAPDNTPEIAAWIASLDEDVARKRVGEIESELMALDAERAFLNDALNLKRRWTEASGLALSADFRPASIPIPEAHLPLDHSVPPRGKTDAVLRLLGHDPRRVWTTKEIQDAMVSRGWMNDDQKDYGSLVSTLSRMSGPQATEGTSIHRLGRGRYRLAPSNQVET